MTRRLLAGVSVALLAAGGVRSAEAQAAPKPVAPQVQAELMQVRQAVWLAWFKGDRRALADLLSDDLVAINADAEAWEHKGDALHSGESFAADGGELVHLEFPTTEFQVYGDIAVLYSNYAVEFRERGQTFTQSGRSTEIFHRVKKRWVNTGWHLDLGPPSAK
jgi:ketosteroid isomerase-like protein